MFKDESSFQGVKEFETPIGRLRCIEEFAGSWNVFEEDDDERAFRFCAQVSGAADVSCLILYKRYCKKMGYSTSLDETVF